ncbi:MAG TPA: FAD-dependent oxidoreductase, partial [Tepidisphaeraceae bacterium]|nr:FAD-dependent oxidoreductase [Tepidisphaeraceae bacterium]
MAKKKKTDILIVGGGVGGCAAAMAASSLGLRVILTEETDWLGGQLTSQCVPPDEHRWIEQFGCTKRYRAFRDGVRAYYKEHYPLSDAAKNDPKLNPGGGFVSKLCAEPRVYLAVIEQMLAGARAKGTLEVLLNHKPIAATVDGDRVTSVMLKSGETNDNVTISADYILDATELGELLPLAKVECVVGAESKADTNEPHAIDGPAEPGNVQSLTWCFAMAFDPNGEHVIEKPKQYERWRDYVPQLTPPWTGKLLSWTYCQPITLKPMTRHLLPTEPGKIHDALFMYRQIVMKERFVDPSKVQDVTLVNWPMNDYWEQNIIDQPADVVARGLEESRQLSLSFFYWLQTEAPRADGKTGYPNLRLCPEIMGTRDGLAKAPYIRESRRIKAVFTVTENHVGADARHSFGQAQDFPDSVGIGFYRIDLHPSTGKKNYIDIPSLPFQIPLGALLPVRVTNFL